MKILHISASYKPAYLYGGPIQSVGKLCEALSRQQAVSLKLNETQDVEVFTTTANGKSELDVEVGQSALIEGVPVTYFKRWTKDHTHFSPGLLIRLQKVLRQARQNNDKTIVHIHAWWNLVSVLSCLVAKWYNIPVVLSPRGMLTTYTQHNRHSFTKRVIHSLIGKKLLRYSHIHATSDQEKEDIQKIVGPKNITIIPNLVSFEYPISSGIDWETTFINRRISVLKMIFLSRIEQKKGLELLFDAMATLDIECSLTIAGSGAEPYVASLKSKAKKLKINEQIDWIGQVSNENKYMLLAEHHLMVLTSYNENFANVVIESLSVGTPVLISNQVGLADYVEHKDLGWICSLNTQDITRKIIACFDNQPKRESIRKAAPKLIREDFNDKFLVQRYLALYKQILRLP